MTETMSDQQPNKEGRRARRKRKSFMQNAKSFAKKGCFGRGSEVDPETYNYFLNIINLLRSDDGPSDIEEKETLANNALQDWLDKIQILAFNQVCCRALEDLLPFTSTEIFESILQSIAKDYRVSCSDQYASHILEKLLEICFLRVVAGQYDETKHLTTSGQLTDDLKRTFTTEWDEAHLQKCSEFVVKTSNFMVNNLEDFVWNLYATHVLRRCLFCLAGIFKQAPTGKSKKTNPNYKEDVTKFDVSEDWLQILKECVDRLQSWPQFNELPYNEYTSALLQHVCIALKYTNKNTLKSFGKKILHETFLLPDNTDGDKKDKDDKDVDDKVDEISIPKVFNTEASVRLLEVLLSVAGRKLMTQLNAMLFTGRLKAISTYRSANFAVQKLLLYVKEEKEFTEIFDELSPSIEELLQLGFTGVVSSLAQACARMKQRQGPFILSLAKALNCEKNPPVSFFICVTKLKPSNVCVDDPSSFVHLHGSLITQAILNFNKPIKFIQSLLDVKTETLLKIFCDPKGSHIVDAFFASKSVGEQSKIKLVKQLEGNFLAMALSKHGSQALEALFREIPQKMRPLVLDDLAEHFNQLNGSQSGQIIAKKLHIEVYKKTPKRWEACYEKADKTKEMFKDITK